MAEQTGALSVVRALQSKVGTSLVSVQNMMSPADAQAAILQAGAATANVPVLQQMANTLNELVDAVRQNGSVLLDALQLQQDADRRAREQLAELNKERTGLGMGVDGDINIDPNDLKPPKTEEKSMNWSEWAPWLTAGLMTWLATRGGAGAVAKSMGKKLFKGGLFVVMADIVGDIFKDLVDDYVKDPQTKEELKSGLDRQLPAAVGGAALFGLPGAISALAATGLYSVGEYLTGQKTLDKITYFDWASIGMGVAGAFWAKSKIAGLVAAAGAAGTKVGTLTTLGAAVFSTPVIVGAGIAIALAIGTKWLMDRMDKYREQTAKNLNDMTKQSDKEFNTRLAQQKESWLEAMGMTGLAGLFGTELSQLGQVREATEVQKDRQKAKKTIDEQTQKDLANVTTKLVSISQADLEEIMSDRTKTSNLTDTIENLIQLGMQGNLGPDSKQLLKKLLSFGNRLQGTAEKLVTAGDNSHYLKMISTGGMNPTGGLSMFGGDYLQKYGLLDTEEEKLMEQMAKLKQRQKEIDELFKQYPGDTQKGKGLFSWLTYDTPQHNQLEDYDEENKAAMAKIEQQLAAIEYKRNKRSIGGSGDMLQYKLEDLRKIFTDEELREMIKANMMPYKASSFVPIDKSEAPSVNTISSGNKISTVNNVTSGGTTYVGPMVEDIDPGLKRAISGYDNAPY